MDTLKTLGLIIAVAGLATYLLVELIDWQDRRRNRRRRDWANRWMNDWRSL